VFSEMFLRYFVPGRDGRGRSLREDFRLGENPSRWR
jgi:hypothetical protein